MRMWPLWTTKTPEWSRLAARLITCAYLLPIAGCTSSGADVVAKTGSLPPGQNKYKSGDYQPVRKAGVVEKCILCHHRTTHGLQPACVDVCPADARIFGDLNDPNSAIAHALKKHQSTRLKVEEGTDPNVYYIRSYNNPKV
ncbi:MAG: 4Fe-4S dicluster domain-containing protein [Desulfopila sp.]